MACRNTNRCDKWKPRPWRLVGYRGKMLIILGIAWIAFGAEALTLPEAEYIYHEVYVTSPPVRGGLWITAGAVAIATAFRPVGRRDTFAWPMLYTLPAVRALAYLFAWTASHVERLPTSGYQPGLIYAVMFGAMAGVVVFLSGWPDPLAPPPETLPERGEEPTHG